MRFQLLLLVMVVACAAYAQTNDPRIATSKTPLSAAEQITLPAVDNDALREQELARRSKFPDASPQFAVAIDVDINPDNHGTWELLPNGNALWRLRLLSKQAFSLNLGFTQYDMPDGGTLVLYTPDQKQIQGPFSMSDNETHEQLWTPILRGEELVIEVQLPASQRSKLRLQLSKVNHDFMNFFEITAGACHLDAFCGEANGWAILDRYREAIQAVAVYGFGGTNFCTGFLINNTQGDCTPYFMTANHCGVNAGNAPSMIVYWNYQNSTCREPRANGSVLGDGLLDNFNTGAVFRASYALTDFTLVELDDSVSATADAWFAGWTLEADPPTDTVVLVHHPGGEEKRVSLEYDGTIAGAWGSGNTPVPDGNYLIVTGWDIGASEGGSSGAPLFDQNQRVVGQLRGGTALCNVDGYDAFGWFRYSWQGGGAAASALQPWLDPANSNITSLNGKSQSVCNITLTADVPFQSVCTPNAVNYQITISESFAAPVQLTLSGLPEGINASFSQNPAAPGSNITISISNTGNLSEGIYTLTLQGTDGVQATDIVLGLLASSGLAPVVTLSSPAADANKISLYPELIWTSSTDVATFQLQIATDWLFTNIVRELTDWSATSVKDIRLEPLTTYFWRVRGNNTCGEGDWSEVRRFTTAEIVCTSVAAADLPKEIFDLQATVVNSSVDINLPGTIVDVRINNLDITHSWVGDLQVSLASPAGLSVRLFDRPGVPGDLFGCGGENLKVNFSDNAENTAQQLETTCNENPAFEGNYQPLDPFALLAGKPAAGKWTLAVEDSEQDDGGFLNTWTLEVCAVKAPAIAVSAEAPSFETCADKELNFELYIGDGFDPSGVTLSAQGNLTGSAVSFEPNPAAPGDTVQVSIQNIGQEGIFILNIAATDGKDTANTAVQITSLGVPQDFVPLFPSNGATNIPLSTSLEWEAASGANAYVITVTKSPGNITLLTDTITATTYFLSNLELGTTYNWSIQAINACGVGESESFSFATVPNLSFGVTPFVVNACPTDRPAFNIVIGGGFGQPAAISYSVEPEIDLPITFSADPNNVPVGTTVKAMLGDLTNVPRTAFTITFRISDGTYSATDEVTFRLRGVPGVPLLQQPTDGVSTIEQTPVLVWNKSNDATSYRVEIATDDRFNNIVRTATVTDTTYTIDPMLGGGRFYWRITSLNDCGFSTSGIFDFFIQAAGIREWQGQRVVFHPNPTNGLLQVVFAQPLSGDVAIEVFSTNGQLLQRRWYNQPGTAVSLDLSAVASGTYMVRIVNGAAALTERILVQK